MAGRIAAAVPAPPARKQAQNRRPSRHGDRDCDRLKTPCRSKRHCFGPPAPGARRDYRHGPTRQRFACSREKLGSCSIVSGPNTTVPVATTGLVIEGAGTQSPRRRLLCNEMGTFELPRPAICQRIEQSLQQLLDTQPFRVQNRRPSRDSVPVKVTFFPIRPSAGSSGAMASLLAVASQIGKPSGKLRTSLTLEAAGGARFAGARSDCLRHAASLICARKMPRALWTSAVISWPPSKGTKVTSTPRCPSPCPSFQCVPQPLRLIEGIDVVLTTVGNEDRQTPALCRLPTPARTVDIGPRQQDEG